MLYFSSVFALLCIGVVCPGQLQFKGFLPHMIMYLTLKIPQEHMQLTLIIIASFLAVLQQKKTLTKCKSFTKQLILNMRLSGVLCLIWSLAIRVLAVPASSAPLQCIFSHGGIILHPHCTLMSHTLLSN